MRIELINGNLTIMLDDVVSTNGKCFKRIIEGDDFYVYVEIYEKYEKSCGEYGNFEVFLKRYVPKSVFDKNNEYTHIEKYPSTNEWGRTAWTWTQRKYLDKFLKKAPWRKEKKL